MNVCAHAWHLMVTDSLGHGQAVNEQLVDTEVSLQEECPYKNG